MDKRFSDMLACGHCDNVSKMPYIGSVSYEYPRDMNFDPAHGPPPLESDEYCVLQCPACQKINIATYYWHEFMESEEDVDYNFKLLYPSQKNIPLGLPTRILKAYKAAEKVKTVDVNAYVILLRRLLEEVCLDRNAKPDKLFVMLEELANRNEIPEKLVKVAKGLRDFGNIGAHAGAGELGPKEIPIVTSLCLAILEYIYSAPHLAQIAEDRINAIKNMGKN